VPWGRPMCLPSLVLPIRPPLSPAGCVQLIMSSWRTMTGLRLAVHPTGPSCPSHTTFIVALSADIVYNIDMITMIIQRPAIGA